MRSKLLISFSLFCLLCVTQTARGAEPSLEALQNEVRGLKESMAGLQSMLRSQSEVIQKQGLRIAGLERGEPQTLSSATPQGAPTLTDRPVGLDPEIGVVGTVQAQLTENTGDGEGRDTLALKEIELNLAQFVDPYSRLDAVISFNDALEAQNVEIEEAYYTRWGLPFGFLGQIGKFRSKIGKQNLQHLDQLDTVDYPLVIQDFFGEEGLSSSGVRLQNWIPNPADTPLEITAELLRGNNGASFSGISRRPIFDLHLKSFFEPSKDTGLELGSTVMFGDENINRNSKGEDRYGVHLFGFDVTLLKHLAEGRTLKLQSELYFQDRSSLVTANHNPWGFYTLLDYRFSPRWSAGVRFDYLEPRAMAEGHVRTTALSPYLTFWQSEFANFRLQVSHTDPADPAQKVDNALFFQANFLIGAHNHPVQ